MQKAPPCLFIKEAINALEISLSTWIQSAAKLKPVIIYIRHWWKRTRPSEEPGGAGRRWGVSPPECSRRRPGSTKLVPAHQSAAKAPQRRRHMPSDKGVSGWSEGFWRKCSCWFHQHMKEVIRRKLQTPACGWATFMSQMNDSLEWPPPTPPVLLSDSWCFKSLFYPIWWRLPLLLTHPPIMHFVSVQQTS